MQHHCIVCGSHTPAADEAWDVGLCRPCAMDVMVPLVGRALVLAGPDDDAQRKQGQVLDRLREAMQRARHEQAGVRRDEAAGRRQRHRTHTDAAALARPN